LNRLLGTSCKIRSKWSSFCGTCPRVLINIYIVLRYTKLMRKELTTAEYQALAELRYRIRKFLREGDTVASESGLEPQQYLLLLMIRGIPDGQEATVSDLAERLVLKHHSVVELIDRMETHGYVRRSRSREDRRSVLVSLHRGAKSCSSKSRSTASVNSVLRGRRWPT